jgi:hypothetical protein
MSETVKVNIPEFTWEQEQILRRIIREENRSNEAIDTFMSWLDCFIEEVEHEDENFDTKNYENKRIMQWAKLDMLQKVERKAKKLGFITPEYRGHRLGWKPD